MSSEILLKNEFGTIELFALSDEVKALRFTHSKGEGSVSFYGGQVLTWQPKGQQPVFWLSKDSKYSTTAAIRGGIPVCWPWFGNAEKNPAQVQALIAADNPPAHGFARSQNWTLTQVDESDDLVVLVLSLDATPSPLWNGEARLKLTITLSTSGLELALTTTAGNQPIAISQALHTYFPTDDIHQTHIAGYDGATYTDALDDWQSKQQNGEITFTAETDRIYFSSIDTTNPFSEKAIQYLYTPSLQLALESNSKSAVVWNPWIEKSARLSQFANDAWQRMFCVETANVLSDFVTLEPAQSATLTMKLTRA